jgi:hypothetical protein
MEKIAEQNNSAATSNEALKRAPKPLENATAGFVRQAPGVVLSGTKAAPSTPPVQGSQA